MATSWAMDSLRLALGWTSLHCQYSSMNSEVKVSERLSCWLRAKAFNVFSSAWDSLTYTIKSRKEELLISAVLIFMVLAVSSTVMYYIENPAQPQKFSSIPQTMWWGVVTLSTVGYGDIYPITPLGKLVGSMVAISGIALFALPAGIIAAGLVESLHHRKGWDREENEGKAGGDDAGDTARGGRK